MAVNIQHLCMPPFVPALCIEIGYFIRNGRWLTEISVNTVVIQFTDRLFEWVLGSLIVAPVGAVIVGVIVYFISSSLIKQRRQDA